MNISILMEKLFLIFFVLLYIGIILTINILYLLEFIFKIKHEYLNIT